jgi:hypothetical protein
MRVAYWLFAGLAVFFVAGFVQASQAEEYPVRRSSSHFPREDRPMLPRG